jgi:two-component system phosphate regulon sensor histidine kinase PhoR
MSNYRNILIFVSLTAIVTILTLLFAVTTGMFMKTSMFIALVSPALLLVFAFWQFTDIGSISNMVDKLDKGQQPSFSEVTAQFRPLCKAITCFVSDSEQKRKETSGQLEEKKLEMQLLKRQKTNVEKIIQSINDAVLVTDSSDRIILSNESARKLFGFDSDLESAPNINYVIKDSEIVELITKSRTADLRGVKHEVQLGTKKNPAIYECVINTVKDQDSGQITGIITILHDITREREVSQMKNDFVSHVSHELKTPLSSINAYAEMLVDGEAEDPESIKQFCTIIQTQAQRLNRLIEEILNISRIESGLIKVDKQDVSVPLLIQEAVKMITGFANEKNVSIKEPSAIIYGQTFADRDMISQVIINLLSNAVKYTPSGGSVEIDVQINEADDIVKVTVTDTGVGIPPADVGHVFDKFYRVEANKKCAKGTGLGLNLVKQIVEKVHGGKVFVKSEQGRGSTFGFELPLTCQKVENI